MGDPTPPNGSPVSWHYISRIEHDIRDLRQEIKEARESNDKHCADLMTRFEAQASMWNAALEKTEQEASTRVTTVSAELDDLSRRAAAVLTHYENRREDARQLLNDAAKGVIILILGGVFATYILPLLHLASGAHP